MTQTISIVSENPKGYNSVVVGDRTVSFIDRQNNLADEAKDTLIDEAIKILSHCIFPGTNDNITNIAIGYVQSGKTLSFTTLSALAADNGFRVIIYFTGTKNNLQEQTFSRLEKDLDVPNDYEHYRIFKDYTHIPSVVYSRVKYFLQTTETTLLFPILKHSQHIDNLTALFSDVRIASVLGTKGVLIIDDEADQSSFNTYARENAANAGEWGYKDAFSSTYNSILNLRKVLPCHSYVQYTATPQAAFLINNADILSPKYHTVLTPGADYTGGKFFFNNTEGMDLIQVIPDEEVYHHTRNAFRSIPKSLKHSLQEFIISVAIVVFIQKRKKFLSMMIHADGLKLTNELFHAWIQRELDVYLGCLQSNASDPARIMWLQDLQTSYKSIAKYITNCPAFEDVIKVLPQVIIMTDNHLIQSSVDSGYDEEAKNNVDWEEAQAHILIGADMLNRGFTVENLSMTYLCRSTKGKSNADTIEQRCRFFGYKRSYADVCRVYLPAKNIQEYKDYVEHEEVLRTNLKACNSLSEFSRQAKAMILAGTLNPTRTNILSSKLIRNKMFGWRQMGSIDCIEHNKKHISAFISLYSSSFTLYHDYQNDVRNHRYIKISIEDFIKFFTEVRYQDVPNITRKVVTIQYLCYLKEVKGLNYVYVIEMSYAAKPRKRKIKDGRPEELFMGYAHNGSYPGDKEIKFEDSLCVQIHHVIADDLSVKYGNKDFYNLAIYYPENEDYITLNSDEYDD
jgi:hypothetical protein